MAKKILIYIHGVGGQSKTKFDKDVDKLKDRILDEDESLKNEVIFQGVYYHDLLQSRQEDYFDKIEKKVDKDSIREQILYKVGDAFAHENKSHLQDSKYQQIQHKVYEGIKEAYKTAGDENAEVVILAHSLGAQIISSYIWDAQKKNAGDNVSGGVFKFQYNNIDGIENDQQTLRKLKSFITIGCNIPIFVSSQDSVQSIYSNNEQLLSENKNNLGYDFNWVNMYEADDILGWPLQTLGDYYNKDLFGASYTDAVKDIKVDTSESLFFAHTGYKKDSDVIEKIVEELRKPV